MDSSEGNNFPQAEEAFLNPTNLCLHQEQQEAAFGFGNGNISRNDSSSSLSTASPAAFGQPSGTSQAAQSDTNMVEESTLFQDLNQTDSAQNPKPKKTRRRKPVNCTFCRRRKLKCDRQHPCANCVKRNIESSCTYATEPNNGGSKSRAKAAVATANPVAATAPDVTFQQISTATGPFSSPSRHKSSSSSSDYSSTGPTPAPTTSIVSPPTNTLNTSQPRLVSRKPRHTLSKPKFSDFPQNTTEPVSNGAALKKQLDKMEMLVLSMLQEKNSSDDTYSSNSSPDTLDGKSPLAEWRIGEDPNQNMSVKKARESLGMLKFDKSGKSIYHGDTHWGSLFTEIQQLEDLIGRLQVSRNMPNMSHGFEVEGEKYETGPLPFISSGASKMSPGDVLDTIPSRSICDILIDRYFEFCEPCFQLIHAPVFQQEYNEFWANPTGTELVWVSLLLGMLTLSLQSYRPESLPAIFRGNARKSWMLWLEGSELCAFLGKLAFKPSLNNVRSMIIWIYTQAEISSTSFWLERASIAIAMVVRMCQSMGLHRDPKWFNISPYEAEERRRIWVNVQYLDTYCSLTQGLPATIRIAGFDVKSPSNINESDIMPSYEHEPMPIPLSTRTHSSYLIYRTQMTRWLAQVLEVSTAVGPFAEKVTYEYVINTHNSIEAAFRLTPSYLSRSVLEPNTENSPPSQLFQQFWYEIDYLRTVLVLHRAYAAQGMEDPQYRLSREHSLKASTRLLKLQQWFERSPEAEGVRNLFSWFCWHFLIPHFLHASIFNCLALMNHYDTFTPAEQVEQTQIVEMSMNLFNETKHHFGGCMKLTLMLEAMVTRVHEIALMTPEERKKLRRPSNDVHKKNTCQVPNSSPGMTIESSVQSNTAAAAAAPGGFDPYANHVGINHEVPVPPPAVGASVSVPSPQPQPTFSWDPFFSEDRAYPMGPLGPTNSIDMSMAQFDPYYTQKIEGWPMFN